MAPGGHPEDWSARGDEASWVSVFGRVTPVDGFGGDSGREEAEAFALLGRSETVGLSVDVAPSQP